MHTTLTFLTCLSLAATSVTLAENAFPREHYEAMFYDWMTTHNIVLTGEEFVHRLQIFADAEDYITTHNGSGKSWIMAHNAFSHLTQAEFRDKAGLGLNVPLRIKEQAGSNALYASSRKNLRGLSSAAALVNSLPESVDWVTSGAVTTPKNQGECGSCWTFSAIGAIEGAYEIKNKKLLEFSEQMLVDCDNAGENDQGCDGGMMEDAFDFLTKNGGACLSEDYPYTSAGGKNGAYCLPCKPVSGSAPTGWKAVDPTDAALMEALSIGPVSVAIQADENSFQYYSSGVLSSECGTNLDHGVLAVGYGERDGKKYYKIKNSWGTEYGENGYILVERGIAQEGGQCGILLGASYPIL